MKRIFKITQKIPTMSMTSSAEYTRIYTELLQRIKTLFSHGQILLTIVGVIWTLAGTLFASVIQNEMNDFSKADLTFPLVANFLIVFLVGLPTLIAFPFSVKYQDNLRAVISLSAYIKVFYEIPAIFSGEDSNKNNFYAWETLHCDSNLSRTRLFNSEYIVAILAADILSFSYCVACAYSIVQAAKSITISIVFFFVLTGLYMVLLIFLTVHVFRYSRVIVYAMLYGKEYLKVYLDEAVTVGRITEEQVQKFLEYWTGVSKRDRTLSRNLKIRMRILRLETRISDLELSSNPQSLLRIERLKRKIARISAKEK